MNPNDAMDASGTPIPPFLDLEVTLTWPVPSPKIKIFVSPLPLQVKIFR